MDAHAGSPPNQILGYTIRSRTRIYVSYVIPAALEVFLYIAQFVADCAVSYEHFHNLQPDFGWATLSLILIPPLLTFIFVVSSKDQWNNPRNTNHIKFIFLQLLQMILFPFYAIYRIFIRLFWSIEALFQEDNDAERMLCLERAEECSTCELYHLIQAYGQSAPQIILQLFHMLTQDLFRNYQTTNAQAISLVFSAIDLAAVTTAYQRFESQRQVGRHYPWSTPEQVESHRKLLEQNECLRKECAKRKRVSERTIASFPESDKIMANFRQRSGGEEDHLQEPLVSESRTHEVRVHGVDELDNDAVEETALPNETTVLIHNNNNSELPKIQVHNATDDDKIRISPKLHLPRISEEMRNVDEIEIFNDTAPESPAPLPPTQHKQYVPLLLDTQYLLRTQVSANSDMNTSNTTRNKRSSKTVSQLETLKDMFIVNAQLYIKEHLPHPPKLFTSRVDDHKDEEEEKHLISSDGSESPMKTEDVTDFFLPRPTKVINGIQQDDFAGKTIAFFGWISFVIMRMLSLATFCVFFPKAFFILVAIHYLVMFVALHLETRYQKGLNRTLFYVLLAYVYIFVILEFRIKFKHIRLWFVGFFTITMIENIVMTSIWYAREEFESWWFGFIFEGIIYSGILFVATLIVYYFILKPKDVTLIVEDNNDNKEIEIS